MDNMNSIYAFAFAGNISSKVLYRLKSTDCSFLAYPNNIDFYLKMLLHDQPRYILGMGVYSGKDQESIRIETTTNNKFRNEKIEPLLEADETLTLKNFLIPTEGAKLASGLGNSWCNLVSWKIMQLINQKLLSSKYSFLHIPTSTPLPIALTTIEKMISLM